MAAPRDAPMHIVAKGLKEFWVLAGITAAWIALGFFMTYGYVMDDTLITLRYAYQFAHLGLPVWNPADLADPSMGFTSVVWMLLNSVAALVTSNKDALVVLSKVIALTALVPIAGVFCADVHAMRIGLGYKVLTLSLIFSQFGYAFHANSGMETILFSSTVLLAVRSCALQQTRRAYGWGIFAFFVRPEGGIVVALLCLIDVARRRIGPAFMGGGVFAAALTALVGVVYNVYGPSLPNPFYVKQGGGFHTDGLKQSVLFLATIAFPYVLMTVVAVFRLKNAQAKIAAVFALTFFAYFTTVRPLMNVIYRYQWPVLVLLTYASLPAFEALFSSAKGQWLNVRRFGLVGILALTNVLNGLVADYTARREEVGMRNVTAIGKRMSEFRDLNRWMAYHDAGAVCYHSDWNTHETIGLTNRAVAKREITEQEIFAKSEIILSNFDLPYSGELNAIETAFIARVSKQGYHFIKNLPIVVEKDQRQFVLGVFAKDKRLGDEIFGQMELQADVEPHIIKGAYVLAKKVVKGR